MPRLGRYFVEGQPLHVIQRGNNRQNVFLQQEDFACFRHWLQEAADHAGCAVHAYVLMTNHLHLLLTPARPASLPRMMQSVGRRFVAWYNRSRARSGTLWEGRYRATAIDSDAYLLRCYRYIELNPVRARMVSAPRDYGWSSYRANAEGAADDLVSAHPLYCALGPTPDERQAAYRALFEEALEESFIAAIRTATNGAWALGDAMFRDRIARDASRRAGPLPKGRRNEPLPDDRRFIAS